MRQLGYDIADSHAQIRVLKERIARLEREAQPQRSANELASAPKLEKSTLSLTREEERLVRQFIKVLPSQSSAAVTVQPGQPLGTMITAPLPDAIIEQIPRLSGARFSIDSSGAIIISGNGSSRVDAVVTFPH